VDTDERATILRWHHITGFARHAGVSVDMAEAPRLAGIEEPIVSIEFIPGVAANVNGRPMTGEECIEAAKALVRMASDARDALISESTLVVVCSK